MFTAPRVEEDRLRCFAERVDGYAGKPFSPGKLVVRASALLRRPPGPKPGYAEAIRKSIRSGEGSWLPGHQ